MSTESINQPGPQEELPKSLLEAIDATNLSTERPQLSLEDLVEVITNALKDGVTHKTMAVVREAMANYQQEWNEWKRFEFWDDKKKYTRNLIATDNATFTLMLLCWNPGKSSPIHDHAGSECFMRTITGKIVEYQYAYRSTDGKSESKEAKEAKSHSDGVDECCMKPRSVREFGPGGVVFINDSVGLHKIENPSATEPAITLHCYIPPYMSCHCYNEQTGSTCVGQMVFDTEHGEKLSVSH